jgi:hypothetical protein
VRQNDLKVYAQACAMMAAARSFWTLMCGNILYTATAVVSGAPYTTVYTRVPLRQRGLYNRSAAAPRLA